MLEWILRFFGAGKRARYERDALGTANWFLGGSLPSGREFPELADVSRYPFIDRFLDASWGVYENPSEAGFHLAHQLIVGALEALPATELGRLRSAIQTNKYEGPIAQTFLAFTSLTEIAIEPSSAGSLADSQPAAVITTRLVARAVGVDVLRVILEDVVQALAGNSDRDSRRNDRIMQRLVEGLGLKGTLDQLRMDIGHRAADQR